MFYMIYIFLDIAYNIEPSRHWCQSLIQKLISVFWILYYNRPKNASYCTIYVPGKLKY